MLPIWEYIENEIEVEGKKKPSGLIVLTDTQTNNADKIIEKYDNGECTIPTVIMHPGLEYVEDSFKQLAERNTHFILADMEMMKKRDEEIDEER